MTCSLECFLLQHDPALVAVAACVCLVGSILTMQLARRSLKATKRRKRMQATLAGIMGGMTIWVTHFIAMLAYDPGVAHGFVPSGTILSLLFAIGGVSVSMMILAHAAGAIRYIFGGLLFAIALVGTHHIGMSAFGVAGHFSHDQVLVALSVCCAVIMGGVAFHRLVTPSTRYCWLGAAFFMVVAIVGMHFTAMGAMSVEPRPGVSVRPDLLPDHAMGFVTFGVAAMLLLVGFVGLSAEVDLERESLERIARTALEDPLTGLANRVSLTNHIKLRQAEIDQGSAERVMVMTIDLDLFKEINDLHGHAAGDEVLRRVAHRIADHVGNEGFAARTGGDEFVVIRGGLRRISEAGAFAERLHAVITETVQLEQASLRLGASIGFATSVRDGRDVDALLHKSDMAMYRAKNDPDHFVCAYDKQMELENRERLLMIRDLRAAIEREEFELVYQLQNDANSRRATGFEALIRWNHPERGRVSPGAFIPLAEETGLIREIGTWVLRTACKEAATWDPHYTIAVNVAPQQLAQPSFLETLSDILFETGLKPERLELEITEQSIMDDQEHALRVMHAIREKGVRIAMDDFGTGYSSLATLRSFPFDKIKIDREFVRDVHLDRQRAAIVRSTLLLGEALEIPVLAEGVEGEDELSFLAAERVRLVQGFLFGRPLEIDQLHAFLTPDRATAS